LRQFGTIEINRDDFHRYLDDALGDPADFMRLPLDVSGADILDIIEKAHGRNR
jgi:leucyl/phenylalanyl-tRNA--protein transferase